MPPVLRTSRRRWSLSTCLIPAGNLYIRTPSPCSSGDRAPPSGGGSAGSNPARGAFCWQKYHAPIALVAPTFLLRQAIELIVELLDRISAVEELSGRAPELRHANRINSVHSSTAIEGNELTLAQVEDVSSGEPVFAPPRQVWAAENALVAYHALGDLDPWSVDDFLKAHGLLTAGPVVDSGACAAGVGERPSRPPQVTHVLAWMSTETLIRAHQDGYYAALQASREPEIDAAVFIDYMFGVITGAIESYEVRAKADTNVGANVGRNVGVNDAVHALLRVEPTLSAAAFPDGGHRDHPDPPAGI